MIGIFMVVSVTYIDKDQGKKACEARGGLWTSFDFLENAENECILPTSDAGKICTDSSQCESVCIATDSDLISGENATGKCHGWNESGWHLCSPYVTNGKAVRVPCP